MYKSLTPEPDDLRCQSVEELRQEIQAGAEQIKQGQYQVYASADELMDDIERRGRERLVARLANNP